jgi:hypothetical protein
MFPLTKEIEHPFLFSAGPAGHNDCT